MVRLVIGVSIALLILWFLGELIGIGLGLLWRREQSRRVFKRRLRRNGLPERAVEAISVRYHAPGLIRHLIRSERS